MSTFSPYRRRRFEQLPAWSIGDTTLKAYAITVGEAPLSTALATAAYDYVSNEAETINGADAHGSGYAMVHHGEQAVWLLAHWWAHVDIAMRLLASAPADGLPEFVSRDAERFHACVWEHVVINHERDAWVRHVLTDTPDLDAYRADALPDGWY
ncbi:MAG: hypothetical protein AAGC71_11255 [Pseudomonadota bacterium]